MDKNINEIFSEVNQDNEIKINSDEDDDLKSDNSDVEMISNEKNNHNFNIESSLESDNWII